MLLAVIGAPDFHAFGHFKKTAANAGADTFTQGFFIGDLFIEKITGKNRNAVVVVAAVDQIVNIVLYPGTGSRSSQFIKQQ
jgi:hypothetical protein